MESILQSIKKLLGIQEEYTVFDQDILVHINSAFAILNQLNIGPAEGFYISDDSTSWDMYITSCNLTMIRTFIFLKVKIIFDPPNSTALIESINRTLSELEFRLYIEGDSSNVQKGGDNR